jgi:hypothetical protein
MLVVSQGDSKTMKGAVSDQLTEVGRVECVCGGESESVEVVHGYCTQLTVLKPHSWTYNFIEVSGHNLEGFILAVSVYYVNMAMPRSFKQLLQLLKEGGGGGSKTH